MVAYNIWDVGEAFESHIFYYGVIGLMVKTTDCESVNESSILS